MGLAWLQKEGGRWVTGGSHPVGRWLKTSPASLMGEVIRKEQQPEKWECYKVAVFS